MITRYTVAVAAATAALGVIVLGIAGGPDQYSAWLLVAAAGGPVAVASAVAGRLDDAPFPFRAAVGGAVIGPLVATLGAGIVFGFVYLFVLGFADQATALADRLQADSRLVTALASPWVLVLLIQLAVVAPLIEEFGKALGAGIARPTSRQGTFLAGVAAGAGFAIVENVMYVGFGAAFGGAWPEIALARMLGVAVHPLASGLVMLGVWDSRTGRRRFGWLKGFVAGAGIHALWNGSLVAIAVVETAFDLGGTADSFTTAGFGYMIGLAAVLAAALWWVTHSAAEDGDPVGAVDFRDSRAVAAWTLITASILVPATILITAFPDFYGG